MKQLPRFIIRREDIDENHVARIDGDEMRHLRDAARLRPGSAIRLLDQFNREYVGRIERFSGDAAFVRLLGDACQAVIPYRLTIAAALIKGPRMDFLVEKAAELGVHELVPLMTARSVLHDPGRERLARWERLAAAAAKQSLGARQMIIRPPTTLAELNEAPATGLRLVCEIGGAPLIGLRQLRATRDILLACGPEGGFNAEEGAMMRAAGFIPVGLAPNRLRAETAVIAAASIVVAQLWEAARDQA
ncbi:MAG TPA: RsmE family RNA methyltransferase [Candidatus Binataceae bacterium]|jgi:16S rRNA (uracil1498-N3)-methyltransferase|nr:RsmE family RNA methyltransferase [Candidatus Binataceae bacterium]